MEDENRNIHKVCLYFTHMKEYSAYIFDFDNTLVDSSHGLEVALRAGFREFGIPYDPKKLPVYMRTPLRDTWEKYKPNCPCKFRDFFELVIVTYDRCYLDEVQLFPDAKECIEVLSSKGKDLGVVSNSLSVHINSILDRLNVRDSFGSIVGADRCMNGKPSPEPVRLCLQELGQDAEDAVMIGDAKNDILSGKAAGTDTVLIDRDDLKVCDEETVRVKDLRNVLTPYRRC
jgi:HAD superfamily hydrolase (TIGR01509 family)